MAVKRKYQSTRRQDQARQTRRAILAAAGRLFVEPGYAATPLTAIAAEAGVAIQTVYATFGSKRQLLSELVDVTIAGDDEAVSLPERSFVDEIRALADPRAKLERYARHLTETHARQAAVMIALAGAATADPDAAAIWQKNLDDRRRGMVMFATELARQAGYAPTTTSTAPPTSSGSPWTCATTTGSYGSAPGPPSATSAGTSRPWPLPSSAPHFPGPGRTDRIPAQCEPQLRAVQAAQAWRVSGAGIPSVNSWASTRSRATRRAPRATLSGAEIRSPDLRDAQAEAAELLLQGVDEEVRGAGVAAAEDDDLRVEGQHEGGGPDGQVFDIAPERGSGVAVAFASAFEDPGGLVVRRCPRARRDSSRCGGGGEPADRLERADLAGRSSVAAPQGAVEDEAGAGSHARQQVDDVVGVLCGALPAFGDGGEFAVVLDQDRAGEPGREVLGGRYARPARQRGEQRGTAGRVDGAGHPDRHRPDLVGPHPGGRQALGDGGVDGVEARGRVRVGVDRQPVAAQDPSFEVSEQDEYLVAADVDAEHVSGAGVEAVTAGRTADAAAVGFDDLHPPVGDQPADHDVGPGPGQAGAGGELVTVAGGWPRIARTMLSELSSRSLLTSAPATSGTTTPHYAALQRNSSRPS